MKKKRLYYYKIIFIGVQGGYNNQETLVTEGEYAEKIAICKEV